MPGAQVAVADYRPAWWPLTTRLLIRLDTDQQGACNGRCLVVPQVDGLANFPELSGAGSNSAGTPRLTRKIVADHIPWDTCARAMTQDGLCWVLLR
jgi:hypothetical protein